MLNRGVSPLGFMHVSPLGFGMCCCGSPVFVFTRGGSPTRVTALSVEDGSVVWDVYVAIAGGLIAASQHGVLVWREQVDTTVWLLDWSDGSVVSSATFGAFTNGQPWLIASGNTGYVYERDTAAGTPFYGQLREFTLPSLTETGNIVRFTEGGLPSLAQPQSVNSGVNPSITWRANGDIGAARAGDLRSATYRPSTGLHVASYTPVVGQQYGPSFLDPSSDAMAVWCRTTDRVRLYNSTGSHLGDLGGIARCPAAAASPTRVYAMSAVGSPAVLNPGRLYRYAVGATAVADVNLTVPSIASDMNEVRWLCWAGALVCVLRHSSTLASCVVRLSDDGATVAWRTDITGTFSGKATAITNRAGAGLSYQLAGTW